MYQVIFSGTIQRNKIHYLIFNVQKNEQNKIVEIPVEDYVAKHIMSHLHKYAPPDIKDVEPGNDENPL